MQCWFDGEPGVATVGVGFVGGVPGGEVGEDSAAVEVVVPVERGRFDRVWAEAAVGGDEAVGDAAGGGFDDRTERPGCVEWRVGEEQVGVGEVVGGVGDLACGPVEHGDVAVVGEDVERVEVAVADDPQLCVGSGSGESLPGALQRFVGEFEGSGLVVLKETFDADCSISRLGQGGLDGSGVESMEVGGGSGEGVG